MLLADTGDVVVVPRVVNVRAALALAKGFLFGAKTMPSCEACNASASRGVLDMTDLEVVDSAMDEGFKMWRHTKTIGN